MNKVVEILGLFNAILFKAKILQIYSCRSLLKLEVFWLWFYPLFLKCVVGKILEINGQGQETF